MNDIKYCSNEGVTCQKTNVICNTLKRDIWIDEYANINFCPCCGNPLKKEEDNVAIKQHS